MLTGPSCGTIGTFLFRIGVIARQIDREMVLFNTLHPPSLMEIGPAVIFGVDIDFHDIRPIDPWLWVMEPVEFKS